MARLCSPCTVLNQCTGFVSFIPFPTPQHKQANEKIDIGLMSNYDFQAGNPCLSAACKYVLNDGAILRVSGSETRCLKIVWAMSQQC